MRSGDSGSFVLCATSGRRDKGKGLGRDWIEVGLGIGERIRKRCKKREERVVTVRGRGVGTDGEGGFVSYIEIIFVCGLDNVSPKIGVEFWRRRVLRVCRGDLH